jgi:hypothetical protein
LEKKMGMKKWKERERKRRKKGSDKMLCEQSKKKGLSN